MSYSNLKELGMYLPSLASCSISKPPPDSKDPSIVMFNA